MIDQQRPGHVTTRGIALLAVLLIAGIVGAGPSAYAAPSPARHTAASPERATELAIASHPVQAKGVKGYVYWGYYLWNDKKQTWEYATVGANDKSAIPQDGDVYGFRWALVVKEPRFPRADGDFDAICGDTPAKSGAKRVAFVIDYGSESDAVGNDTTPPAEGVCAVADKSLTAQQALQTEVPVRADDSGQICGINEYPSQSCGSTVGNAEEPPSDEPVDLVLPGDQTSEGGSTKAVAEEDSSNKLVTIGVPVLVVVLLGAGALLLRRRQS